MIYVYIAIGVLFAAVTAWGAWEHNEVQTLTIAIEKQKTEAANTLATATAHAADIDAKNAQLAGDLDHEHQEHQKEINAHSADNARLLADIQRLRDGLGRNGGTSPVPPAPANPGSTSGGNPSAGQSDSCISLLIEGAGLLTDIAGESDANAETLEEAMAWAKMVGK